MNRRVTPAELEARNSTDNDPTIEEAMAAAAPVLAALIAKYPPRKKAKAA